MDGVIFDIDGTLVDSVDLHAEAWRAAFARFGKPLPFERVRSQIGKGGDQLIPFFLSEEEDERFGEELDAFRSQLYRREYRDRVRPFPRVRELMLLLRSQGVRIALASSSKPEDLEHYVGLMEIGDLLDATTSSGDAERSKPHPDIFAVARERLALPAGAEIVVVGDSPFDIEAAARLGLPAIGVRCGGFEDETLVEAGAVALFDDPAALVAHWREGSGAPAG